MVRVIELVSKENGGNATYQSPLLDPAKIRPLCIGYGLLFFSISNHLLLLSPPYLLFLFPSLLYSLFHLNGNFTSFFYSSSLLTRASPRQFLGHNKFELWVSQLGPKISLIVDRLASMVNDEL